MFRLNNQDDDDDDQDDCDYQEENDFSFLPIMNTASYHEQEGFLTLSEALNYDLSTYNFDLKKLLLALLSEHQDKICNAGTSPEEEEENEGENEDNSSYSNKVYYGVIQCINFCRQHVKSELSSNEPTCPTELMNETQIDEACRFAFGKRTSDAYLKFLQSQSSHREENDEDSAALFHHPVIENDAFLFHVEDLLDMLRR